MFFRLLSQREEREIIYQIDLWADIDPIAYLLPLKLNGEEFNNLANRFARANTVAIRAAVVKKKRFEGEVYAKKGLKIRGQYCWRIRRKHSKHGLHPFEGLDHEFGHILQNASNQIRDPKKGIWNFELSFPKAWNNYTCKRPDQAIWHFYSGCSRRKCRDITANWTESNITAGERNTSAIYQIRYHPLCSWLTFLSLIFQFNF